MFDAYTVKKVVPRLLIAAILIQLSWPLFTYMIYIVGQISWGIEGLLYAPFGGSQALELKNILAAVGNTTPGTAAVLTFGGIGVGIVALTLGGTLLMAISVLLALIVAFFVLAARQVLIVVLLVTAPLALVAWILPNTEKMWKIWWESFSKVLFMYPLILLLIAGGKITARIISELDSTNTGNGGFQVALIFIAFFGPYFLIPATFKVAGSAFANITGIMNDRSRGVFDRLRRGRQERAKQTWGSRYERAQRNALINPNRRGAERINTAASWLVDPKSNAQLKYGTMGGRALGAELTQKTASQSKDLAKWMSDAGLNQEALTAIMQNVEKNGGRLDSKALDQTAQQWLTEVDEDGNLKWNTQYRAGANQLKSAAPFLSRTFQSEELGRANIGMAAGLAKSAQGFLNSGDSAEAANYANFLNGLSPGLGDTFKTQSGLISGGGGGAGKVGYSEQVDASGQYVAGGTAARGIQFTRSSVQDITGMKAGQLKKQFVDNNAIKNILGTNTSKGDVEITDSATGETLKLSDSKRLSTLDNIVQAAYGYNTPAETAAVLKDELQKLRAGNPSLATEIEASMAKNRATLSNPEADGRAGPPPAPSQDDGGPFG